ncbi:hypothetical protein WJX74_010575 [Apatococcus lobatus]|uniref:Nucleotide-diphospho-sugar transferase n=1 Tax=Apatococcus lobatus TaxID=904363 RepID=A0AAW1Q963_9CHLO
MKQRSAAEVPVKSFAYALYVTSAAYLCNSIVNVRRLIALNVTADPEIEIVVLHAEQPSPSQQLHYLRRLEVRLVTVDSLLQSGDQTWAQSLTKLRIFELTDYQRIIYFDADGLVMRNMNHLFQLPSTPVAMPRAYWLDQPFYTDALAVIEPAADRLSELLDVASATHGFDMDVMNDLDTFLIVPEGLEARQHQSLQTALQKNAAAHLLR